VERVSNGVRLVVEVQAAVVILVTQHSLL
jgi:hypothetical protein